MHTRRKLSRREAALVREARRKAIFEYERDTMLGLKFGDRLIVSSSITALRCINALSHQADDLYIRLPGPMQLGGEVKVTMLGSEVPQMPPPKKWHNYTCPSCKLFFDSCSEFQDVRCSRCGAAYWHENPDSPVRLNY